jgi:gamma-D-glutamyl-L-lysine dipeptidyl-peptidase
MPKINRMTRPFVKFICLPLLAALALLFISSCQSSVKDLQHEVDNIRAKWVPDSRIAICKAELKPFQNFVVIKGETTVQDAKTEIIKTLSKHNIKLIDSLLILPDTSINKDCFGIVTLSVINLRRDPEHSAELVSQAIMGTPLLILKSQGSWLMVQTPDSYISWTEKSSVRSMSISGLNKWRKVIKVIFRESTGWLYDSTSANSGVVSDLVGGSIMEKTGEMKDWLSVILPDGRKGFIEKERVDDYKSWKESVKCTEESICSTAFRFMGIPYLWGGTSYKGADCSGFVKSVFFQNGLILQRDASLQALHGTEVNISGGLDQLKKGDLLFFGSKDTNGKPHVTHVAIYLGNKDYINAAGRVMINSFDKSKENYVSYRDNTFLLARRIIGVDDNGIVPVIKHAWY